jgi:DOPA 4,5-dioxygenase
LTCHAIAIDREIGEVTDFMVTKQALQIRPLLLICIKKNLQTLDLNALTLQMDAPAVFPDLENKAHYFTILNTKTRPADFGKFEFDVHVMYDTLEERAEAAALREAMRVAFQDKHFFVGEMIDCPVGPFNVPMWEGNFRVDLLQEVLLWLMDHRGNLRILVHKLGGDPLLDHTAGAIFLGDAAPLINYAFLREMVSKGKK